MVLHLVPVVLGAGERLFEDLDGGEAGADGSDRFSAVAQLRYRVQR
jgi:hypothetical protein